MKQPIYLLFALLVGLSSCGNKSAETSKTFCDTACRTQPLAFKDAHPLEPQVTITMKNCLADTLKWTHREMATRQVQVGGFFNESIRINEPAVEVFFRDTSYAWLSFNNCETGRGYLVKLPFSKSHSLRKMNSAINHFDPKFNISSDMRAYADMSKIYVVNVSTDQEETLSFGSTYDINFDQVHDVIDSVHVTPKRIFVRLLKDGEPVDVQKDINL